MLTVSDAGKFLGVSANRIKQLVKEYQLPVISGTRTKIPPETMKSLIQTRNIKLKNPKKVTIATEKGGVGKTFITTNTAALCAERGLKTLVIDVDPEACSTNTLLPNDVDYRNALSLLEIIQHNANPHDAIQQTKYGNLYIIPCKPAARRLERFCMNQSLKYLAHRILAQLENDFDIIFFDLPPSFTSLVASFYLNSDLVIQPCEPSIYCEESVDLTTTDIEEACKEFDCQPPKNVVLLNFFRETETASREARHSLENRYPNRLLPFEVNKSQDAINLINGGLTILDVKLSIKDDLIKLVDYLIKLEKNEIAEDLKTLN